MDLQEFLEVGNLLELYKELLSEKQKTYLIEHFEEDYSLSEIAKKHEVSRQAVYDNIHRGIKLLHVYEEKLRMFQNKKNLQDKLEELKENFKPEVLDKILEELW